MTTSDLLLVGEWLRKRCVDRGETVNSLARTTELPESSVLAAFEGDPNCSTSTLTQVARALGFRIVLADAVLPDSLLAPVSEKPMVASLVDVALNRIHAALVTEVEHSPSCQPREQMLKITEPYVHASKPRSADVVLYLDLDGVVHHEAVLWHPRRGIYMSSQAPGRTLFEWVHHLEFALSPYPDVALVLSSTWCIRPGYAKTLRRLPETLRSRFIGGTFHHRVQGVDPWNLATFRRTARGVQIWADVQRRKPNAWLALDDDVEDWPACAIGNLVACDGTKGLSDASVREALREKLAQCHASLPQIPRSALSNTVPPEAAPNSGEHDVRNGHAE